MNKAVESVDALVVGAGPAGLMAAEVLSAAGLKTLVVEAKPSPARKFLMAGKSGLNLTKEEAFDAFVSAYDPCPVQLRKALDSFGSREVQAWAEGLGQALFTGSTGRVFPVAKKASPLLRSWLKRLASQGVELRRNWRMTALGDTFIFEHPDGQGRIRPKVCVFAMGGASWARLGSNGSWTSAVKNIGTLSPFVPSNVGVSLTWSPHMAPHYGAAIKNISLKAGQYSSRGEMVISQKGLEGGGVYAVSRGFRDGGVLTIDLLPDWNMDQLKAILIQRNRKVSLSNFLKKSLKLSPAKTALFMEFARPLPNDISTLLKALPITPIHTRSMDEAISTGGGVRFDCLTDGLAFTKRPNVFAAGEMLDWDAPTGGYLLTACLATGRLAAQSAISAFVQASQDE